MSRARPERDIGDVALGLLARREHARLELAHKLRQRGYDDPDIQATLDRLAAEGWLDEERFAESYVRSRVERAYGPLRIAAELKERGLDRATIARALAPWQDEWPELALKALHHRFGEGRPQTPEDHRRRRGYLLRRGFPGDQVSRLLR